MPSGPGNGLREDGPAEAHLDQIEHGGSVVDDLDGMVRSDPPRRPRLWRWFGRTRERQQCRPRSFSGGDHLQLLERFPNGTRQVSFLGLLNPMCERHAKDGDAGLGGQRGGRVLDSALAQGVGKG